MRGALRRSRLARAAVQFVIPAPQPVACGPRRDSALPSPTAVPPRPGVAAPIGGSRQRVVSTSRGWSASAVAFVAPSRTVARLAVGALRANVTSKLLSDAGAEPLRLPFGTLRTSVIDAALMHRPVTMIHVRNSEFVLIYVPAAIADRPIAPRPRAPRRAAGPRSTPHPP